MPTYLVKTIKNEMFDIDAEPSETVLSFKEKIGSNRNYDVSAMKLICSGKVLKDDQVLADVGAKTKDEGGFFVCMISASKPAPAPAPVPVPAPAPAPTVSTSSSSTSSSATTSSTSATPSSTSTSAVPTTAPTNPFAGPEFDAAVAGIQAMGFMDEASIQNALIAAYGNPDRAVDFLMNGIPEGAYQAAMNRGNNNRNLSSSNNNNNNGTRTTGTPSTNPGASTLPSNNPLESLRQHPQFNQIRRLVQSNPDSIPQIIDSIGAASPQLFSLIQANREAFSTMMHEPIEDDEDEGDMGDDMGDDGDDMGDEGDMGGNMNPQMMGAMASMLAAMTPQQRTEFAQNAGIPLDQLNMIATLGGMGGGGANNNGGPGIPPGATVIQLTESERASVDSMCAMGFSRQRVLEAYLACDKNEEMAINYLLEHGYD